MTKTNPLMKSIFLLFLTLSVSRAAITVYSPVPYRKAADSPFVAGLEAGTISLENFEDRVVDPRIQMTNGMFVLDQGVDEDDGVLNDRNFGWVWYSSKLAGLDNRWTHEITFPVNGEGQRPLYAGFALLGFVQESLISRPSYYLQVFDGDNQPLSNADYLIPRAVVPDGTEYASSLGDQFVGFYSERGISRILVGNTVRIDHVQFGMAIPEPGTAGLLLGTLLIGLRIWSAGGARVSLSERNWLFAGGDIDRIRNGERGGLTNALPSIASTHFSKKSAGHARNSFRYAIKRAFFSLAPPTRPTSCFG